MAINPLTSLDSLTKSLVDVYAKKLSEQEQNILVQCLNVLADDAKYNRLKNLFPDKGEYRRELYHKHIEFFTAGATYRERGLVAANRVGKSECGAFEVACHATGIYPNWWKGLRFNKPTLIWVGGDTSATVRDIIQKKLLGEPNDIGSGLIPKDCIVETKTRRSVPDAIEIIKVRHSTGGLTTIVLKTYEQGRIAWQGDAVDFVWIDEECPEEVYNEAMIRLMTTNGSIITTFTPLQGLTKLVMNLLANDQFSDAKYPKHITKIAWKDVPHMTEEMKEQMLQATPPQLRKARSEGEPTVGSGVIFPLEKESYVVQDFQIPPHYKRLYGMDVGWNATACCWGAFDVDNDVIYINAEYKQGQAEPIIHASAIKTKGINIRGVIDPASRGRSQIDGESLYALYRKEGLKIYPANNSVETGIYEMWQRLSTGRLKVFSSCVQLLSEISTYHRDINGKIVKVNDHCCDALRYLCLADKSMWSYNQTTQPKVVQFNDYMRACI